MHHAQKRMLIKRNFNKRILPGAHLHTMHVDEGKTVRKPEFKQHAELNHVKMLIYVTLQIIPVSPCVSLEMTN